MNNEQWVAVTWNRSCPLCGSEETTQVSRVMQHSLNLTTVICCKCSLVYTNPIPSENVYNRFYVDAYADYYGHIASGSSLSNAQSEPRRIKSILNTIESLHPIASSRLMEVGPGKGQLLFWAQRRGAMVQGIEPSRAFHEILIDNDLPSINVTLESAVQLGLEPYNFIVMSHVLEHFYDPNIALQSCRDLLPPNGLLVIEVPNILKPYRSLDRYFLRYVHLTNFSPHTLAAMLSKHGFSVIHQDQQDKAAWFNPHSLFVIAQKLPVTPDGFTMPEQSYQDVLTILKKYRIMWRWINGPKWHLFQTYLRALRLARRGKRFVVGKLSSRSA